MTQQNELQNQSIDKAILGRRILLGAVVGLVLISAFLIGVKEPDPAWPKYWMVRPLIVVPFAGGMGGLCNYLLVRFHEKIGLNKSVAVILSLFVFVIGLWLGFVLGLDGTLWD